MTVTLHPDIRHWWLFAPGLRKTSNTGLDTGLHARLGSGPTTLRELLEVPAGSRPGASGSIPIGTGAGCTPGVILTGTVLPWPATAGRPPSGPPERRLPSTRGPPSWRPGGWGGGRRRVLLPRLLVRPRLLLRPRHSAWRGDVDTPSDLDWLVLDIDFKPEGRAMSHFGAGCRDRLLAAARAAGCPIFSSTSGNGAHILARLAASADGVDLGRSMTLPAARDPALTGLTVDRFLPGAKALVCVRFERPMSDITPDVPVPVVSPNDLFSLLAAGRSS